MTINSNRHVTYSGFQSKYPDLTKRVAPQPCVHGARELDMNECPFLPFLNHVSVNAIISLGSTSVEKNTRSKLVLVGTANVYVQNKNIAAFSYAIKFDY